VGGHRHAPAALPLEKIQYPLFGHQSRSGHVRKIIPTEIRSPDHPVRSQSLHRLSYSGSVHPWVNTRNEERFLQYVIGRCAFSALFAKKELQNCASCRRRSMWYNNQKVFLRIFIKCYVEMIYQNLSTPSHFGGKLVKITATLLDDLLARISARIAEFTRQIQQCSLSWNERLTQRETFFCQPNGFLDN
jgi:hypothetical protein